MCTPQPNNLAIYLQGVTQDVEVPNPPQVTFLTTAVNPSSLANKRVWNFVVQGSFSGKQAVLALDYTTAYDICSIPISFEGLTYGTLTINNRIFSATKYVQFVQTSATTIEVTITYPKALVKCQPVSDSHNFFLDFYQNDIACSCACPGQTFDFDGSQYTLESCTCDTTTGLLEVTAKAPSGATCTLNGTSSCSFSTPVTCSF